jgi:hypothetical protein
MSAAVVIVRVFQAIFAFFVPKFFVGQAQPTGQSFKLMDPIKTMPLLFKTKH